MVHNIKGWILTNQLNMKLNPLQFFTALPTPIHYRRIHYEIFFLVPTLPRGNAYRTIFQGLTKEHSLRIRMICVEYEVSDSEKPEHLIQLAKNCGFIVKEFSRSHAPAWECIQSLNNGAEAATQ